MLLILDTHKNKIQELVTKRDQISQQQEELKNRIRNVNQKVLEIDETVSTLERDLENQFSDLVQRVGPLV